MNLRYGSLFSGIGGLDLGFERAGFRCAFQVESNEFCRKVLAKHWPDVPRFEDVKTVGPNLPFCDVLIGGFPCQDVSNAGKGEGIEKGTRSGLWSEFDRIIRLVRPRYVAVENVPGLFTRGFGRVLGDLFKSGYDAEWTTLTAAQFGAPHLRERIFLVAYPDRSRCRRPDLPVQPEADPDALRVFPSHWSWPVADSHRTGCEERDPTPVPDQQGFDSGDHPAGITPDTNGRSARRHSQILQTGYPEPCGRPSSDTERIGFEEGHGEEGFEEAQDAGSPSGANHFGWQVGGSWATRNVPEPCIRRVDDGLSRRVDKARLMALGNAVVVECAEFVARCIHRHALTLEGKW